MEKITSKRKQILYAFAAFGPNLLNIIVATYVLDAFSTIGFEVDVEHWTFMNSTIVAVFAFGIIITIAKIIDGFIDIPLAKLSDGIKSKFGRRKTSMLIGFIPMAIAYVGLLFPLSSQENSWLNTFFSGFILIVFLVAYTMCLLNYYAAIPEITSDKGGRRVVSSWKAFFDVITYSLAFALVPVFVGFGINIKIIALAASPLLLTFLIPFFLLKEKSTLVEDMSEEEKKIAAENNVGMFKQVGETFKNKNFMIWMLVFSFFFFGLQLYLAAQNAMGSGAMAFSGLQIAIMNTSAFAPVPLTLWLYNKVSKKKGFRFAFRTAILSFIIAMVCCAIAYVNFPFMSSVWTRLIVACIGGTIGSYGIGAFFYSPYIIVTQVAVDHEKETGKNRNAMFFAVQGLINACVGALSTGLVWWGLKAIFNEDGQNATLIKSSYAMIYVVILFCTISLILSFKLPKTFDTLVHDPSMDQQPAKIEEVK